MAKTRMTGFSRLIIFLIFVLPLAFFGASYINGEDPMQKLKDFTGQDNSTAVSQNSSSDNTRKGSQELENRILELERDLAIANEKLARCQTKGVE